MFETPGAVPDQPVPHRSGIRYLNAGGERSRSSAPSAYKSTPGPHRKCGPSGNQLNLVYHNFPPLYTSETKTDRKFAKLTFFWERPVSYGKYLVSPGKIWYTFPSKFRSGGGAPMSGGKPGQDLWDLRGGCSAFAADFCLFIPFFKNLLRSTRSVPPPLVPGRSMYEYPDFWELQEL